MASVLKVDQIQSDTGTVNLASNIAFTGTQSFNGNTLSFKTNATERLAFDNTGRGYANNSSHGITYKSSSTGSVRVYGGTGTNQWDVYTNGANIRFSDNTGGGQVVLDTVLNLSAGQIIFPPSQNASSDPNTLDDYEEGTWTPSIAGASSVTNTTGYYTKIGNRVFVQYYSSNFTAGSATPIVSGLPFTAKNVTEGYGGFFTSNNSWTNGFFGYIGPNTAQVESIVNSGGAYATVNTGSNKTIMIFGFYQTA